MEEHCIDLRSRPVSRSSLMSHSIKQTNESGSKEVFRYSVPCRLSERYISFSLNHPMNKRKEDNHIDHFSDGGGGVDES